MKFNFRMIFTVFFFIFCGVFLTFFVKGDKGNPIAYQNEKKTIVGGPFESTNSNSRYALTEAIVEDNTFFFNNERAAFSSPDLVKLGDKYFSIFTPGISFLGIPFYMLGKFMGIPQIMTYALNLLFGIFNLFLIAFLARRLGASFFASLLAGFVFLFATNALPYSLTFTQHQVSVSIIMIGLINSLSKRSLVNNITFGLLYGAGALVDIPNIFLMMPALIYIIFKHIDIEEANEKVHVAIRLSLAGIIIGIIPLVGIFAWYNYQTSNSYTKIGQTIGRTNYVEEGQLVKKEITEGKKDGFSLPFFSRTQLSGAYTLLISDERAWIYYSPIVYFGLFGFVVAYRRIQEKSLPVLLFTSGLVTVVMYTMFGDPWGGWSFGPRYLIPASAVLSSGIGVAVSTYKKNLLFITLFFVTLGYSLGVNVLGALTTAAIPPKIEAIHLSNPIPYTYEYNINLLKGGMSSSLFYNLFFVKVISNVFYFAALTSVLFLVGLLLYGMSGFKERKV